MELTRENSIKDELTKKFSFLDGKINVKRERRVYVDVDLSNFRNVFDHIVNDMGFIRICTITGADEGENFSFIYHLTDDKGMLINLKTFAPRSNPVIKSVGDRFPGGILYERELVDMFGVKVEGLPEGNRYPLPDGWPEGQYPLRKDWNKEMLKN